MMKMKKLIATMLCAAMAVSLSACGEGVPSGQESAETVQPDEGGGYGDVTLTVGFNGDFTTMVDAIIGAAESLNEKYAAEGIDTKITIEADYQTIDNTEFHNNIVFAHKSGEAPDMFICDTDVAGFVNAGCVLDITDVITDSMVEGICTPCTVDGKVYAMPFDLPLRVIYYNKNALSAIGWSEEQVEALPQQIASGEFTLEDFTALCQEVVEKGGATYGLVHRPGAGNDFYDLLNALGGRYYNEEGKLVFDEEGITRMFRYLYDNARTTKITPENLNQMGWDTINKMVGTGEAFAYFGPMFSATYVAQAAGLETDEFAEQEQFVLFPQSQYSDAPFCTAAPQFMSISADTQYPDLCKEIFKELQGDSASYLAHHSAVTYSLSSVKAPNEMDEITSSKILAPVTYMVDYAQHIPAVDNATTLRGLIFDQITSLELGQTTVEQAVEDVKTQAQLNIDDIIME